MSRVHCAVLNARPDHFWLTCSQRYGGHGERETPGLIPNPEAKPLSADGTALETGWESRTPPDNHSRRGSSTPCWGPFVMPGERPGGRSVDGGSASRLPDLGRDLSRDRVWLLDATGGNRRSDGLRPRSTACRSAVARSCRRFSLRASSGCLGRIAMRLSRRGRNPRVGITAAVPAITATGSAG